MLTIYNRLNEGKETQSIIARMSIDIYIIYSMQSLNIYSFNWTSKFFWQMRENLKTMQQFT